MTPQKGSDDHFARLDLSRWLIHFVHARNESSVPCDEDLPDGLIHVPFTTDLEKNCRFDTWDIRDEEKPLDPGASAFDVLLRIMEEGCIRSSWAFRESGNERKLRPTIYGKRSACCFTEMPLYAFLDYVNLRRNNRVVDSIGIALLREELFQAGCRPVISGLSKTHKETKTNSLLPRLLDPSCGISEHEQYRYVAMNLLRGVDWTHEREWRWCDIYDKYNYPSLPIWLHHGAVKFSRIVILVESDLQRERALSMLKEMNDSGCDPYCIEYSLSAIKNTRVISIEELSRKEELNNVPIKIDDIPPYDLKVYKTAVPDNEYVERVRNAIEMAQESSAYAAKEYRETASRNKDGFIADVFGFATLVVGDSQSEFVQALIHLNACAPLMGIGYVIKGMTAGCSEHILGEEEAAIGAAIKILSKEFPDIHFYVRAVWD